MKRIGLVVAYDGTNYCGWQTQPNGITVQGVLNDTLSELLGEKIETIGASRTDAGVHAMGLSLIHIFRQQIMILNVHSTELSILMRLIRSQENLRIHP